MIILRIKIFRIQTKNEDCVGVYSREGGYNLCKKGVTQLRSELLEKGNGI